MHDLRVPCPMPGRGGKVVWSDKDGGRFVRVRLWLQHGKDLTLMRYYAGEEKQDGVSEISREHGLTMTWTMEPTINDTMDKLQIKWPAGVLAVSLSMIDADSVRRPAAPSLLLPCLTHCFLIMVWSFFRPRPSDWKQFQLRKPELNTYFNGDSSGQLNKVCTCMEDILEEGRSEKMAQAHQQADRPQFTKGDVVNSVQNTKLLIDIGNNRTIKIPLRGELNILLNNSSGSGTPGSIN
uniref:Uncharacterized protein n=1 Tax=Leersia perrieri TaxID=77586 RepID=A0A0D9WD82_9ORYZ